MAQVGALAYAPSAGFRKTLIIVGMSVVGVSQIVIFRFKESRVVCRITTRTKYRYRSLSARDVAGHLLNVHLYPHSL